MGYAVKSRKEWNKAFREASTPHPLHRYQREGIMMLDKFRGKALLADDMGLGKTLQALMYGVIKEMFPIVIVCPSGLKLNWAKEFMYWSKTRAHVIEGRTPYPLPKSQVYIINYDIIDAWKSKFNRAELFVFDEAHYIKNPKAKRTKACYSMIKGNTPRIFLTGTPFENKPFEMYGVLHNLKPKLFNNQYRFGVRYCAGKRTAFGWEFKGASNTKELHGILEEHLMIRRLKKDVLKQLPPKQRSVLPFKLSPPDQREYNKARDEFQKFMLDVHGAAKMTSAMKAQQLAQVNVLKQLASKGKMVGVLKWVEDVKEQGEKLVLFTTYRATIEYIEQNYTGKMLTIDGRTKNKQKVVEQFQSDDEAMLLVANIKAGGTGVDGLQKVCSNVGFVEYPWTPAALDQAEDRCHRQGQLDGTNVWYTAAAGTIEEKLMKVIEDKREMFNAIVNGGEVENESMFDALMDELSKVA